MAKPLFGDSPEPAKPIFAGEGEKKGPSPLFNEQREVAPSGAPPVARPLFGDSPAEPPPKPVAAAVTKLAFGEPPAPSSPAPVAPRPSTPTSSSLFAPGSAGETVTKPLPKEVVAPQPVFMDAGQTWLTKLDAAAKKLYPDADAATHARMLIGWRALLPYSEKAVMTLGDRELKGAAMLASQQANAARIIAQSPVPDLLERLSKALSGSAKRSWFGVKKPEDPSKIVTDLQAQEPAIQKAFDDNQDARTNTLKLHSDLLAYYQAADCLSAVGEDTWKPSLSSRGHLLHQSVYNLELTIAHLQQQEKLLLQWREDIQRLVYLVYPTWQMGQQS